jgi:hypothetical protein
VVLYGGMQSKAGLPYALREFEYACASHNHHQSHKLTALLKDIPTGYPFLFL